jgi:hypothetical protein
MRCLLRSWQSALTLNEGPAFPGIAAQPTFDCGTVVGQNLPFQADIQEKGPKANNIFGGDCPSPVFYCY